MDTAEIHLPKVSLLEGLQIQPGCDEQPVDIPRDQKYVSRRMATAVGAAHTGESQPLLVERSRLLCVLLARGSIDWFFKGKDRSLLTGSTATANTKKAFSAIREGLMGREGFEPSKA